MEKINFFNGNCSFLIIYYRRDFFFFFWFFFYTIGFAISPVILTYSMIGIWSSLLEKKIMHLTVTTYLSHVWTVFKSVIVSGNLY